MAEFNQDAYQPMDGDLYIQEVRTGRFTIYRYSFGSWEQLGAGHSEQDIKTLVGPMEFLGESKGFRRYYRPSQASESVAAYQQAHPFVEGEEPKPTIDELTADGNMRLMLDPGGQVLLVEIDPDGDRVTILQGDAPFFVLDFLMRWRGEIERRQGGKE